MSNCNHVVRADFKAKNIFVCEICKKLLKYHINDASLDIDTTTIKGQKEAREKLKEYSLAETVDVERWVYHLDRVIPLKEQNIREMVGRTTRIGGKAVYYLEVTYYDPTLKRNMFQKAFIADKSIEDYYTELMEHCSNIRRDLTPTMMKEGMVLEYTHYIRSGRVLEKPQAMLPSYMLDTTREVETIRKAKVRELDNIVHLTLATESPRPKFKFNIPNTLLVLGIITILWIVLYNII